MTWLSTTNLRIRRCRSLRLGRDIWGRWLALGHPKCQLRKRYQRQPRGVKRRRRERRLRGEPRLGAPRQELRGEVVREEEAAIGRTHAPPRPECQRSAVPPPCAPRGHLLGGEDLQMPAHAKAARAAQG